MKRHLLAGALLATACIAGAAALSRAGGDASETVAVRRGSLTTTVMATGTLEALESRSYRSPGSGRDLEITYLAPEGARVEPGALLVQLDPTEVQRAVDRLGQELRQLQLDLTSAHSARQDAEATVSMLADGDGVLALDEVKARVRITETARTRARQKHDEMQPLLAQGYVTREEVSRIAIELEQAELELSLAQKRAAVLVNLTHPRERQRAEVHLAGTNRQIEDLIGRVEQTERRLRDARQLAASCSVRAEIPGVVVHDRYLYAASPRKVRVGDRVGPFQRLLTLSTLERMAVTVAVPETDIRTVALGQDANIRPEAFPHLRLRGTVTRIAAVPSSTVENGFEQRRFGVVLHLDKTPADLRPEMTAAVEIVTSTRTGLLLIPVAAVVRHQEGFAARVRGVAGNELRPIEVGASDDEFVEILAGLAEGEHVVR